MLPPKRPVLMRWNPATRITRHGVSRFARITAPTRTIAETDPRILPLTRERAKAKDFLTREALRFRLEKAADAARGITSRTKIQNYDEWKAGAQPQRRMLAPFERHGPRDEPPDPQFFEAMAEALGYVP
jgi:hypothetical protein